MADIDKTIINILDRLTNGQIKTNEIMEKWNYTMDVMNIKLNTLNNNIDDNTDNLGSSIEVIGGMKDLIKEFSLYAAQREELDRYLKDNIELIGTMWQESINIFTETKYLIEGIHTFSQEISEKRSRILSSMNSEKYAGINILQEWMLDLFVELINKFSYKEITHSDAEKWMVNYLIDTNQKIGSCKMPQYLFLDDRIKASEDLINAIIEKFNISSIVEITLWSNLLVFHSILDGNKFIEYPKLAYIKKKIQFLEDTFYE